MKIFIVTINYNGSEKTTKLLESLNNQNDKDFEIIIVDNASEIDDFEALGEWIKSNSPNAFLLRNEQNLGFSGGCNRGISKALEMGADWHILLNNDTSVEKDFISVLRADLGLKNGIVGLPIDEMTGNVVYGGRLRWLKPTLRHSQDLNDVQYAIGGAMCIHKTVIEKIGMLDQNYFLYFEDVDYSVRARKSNITISFLAAPIVRHIGSASTKLLGVEKLLYYHYRNSLYFNSKNGPAWVKFLVWPWSCVIIIKQIVKIILGINRNQSKAILSGVVDFYNGNLKKISD